MCKVFFFCCAPLGAATFRRGQSKKKNTLGGVFVFAPAPRLFGGAGAKKQHPAAAPRGRSLTHCGPGWRCLPLAGVVFFFLLRPCPDRGGVFFCCGPGWCFFFCSGPVPAPNGASPFPAFPRGRSKKIKKKKHPGWCFFFCSGPVPAPNGASPSLAFRRGRSKKKNTLGGVFFFALAPCRRPTGLLLPLPFAGAAAKKNTLGGVFFFLLRPRADAHSLTAGLGGDASPSPIWCFFFAAAPPGPGWCFFFCCGPARTLTHSRWAGAISARPGWCFFFAAAPPGLLDNNKKCLGYYIGSKKTRRGHSKKKKHHFQLRNIP